MNSLSPSPAPTLDLLRERRESLGLEPITSVLRERQPLLRRGLAIGGALFGAALGVTALVFLRHQVVKSQMGQLLSFEAEAAGLQAQLTARKGKVEKLTATNRQLSEALTNVRTTSALLTDLQLRTPDGVQLIGAEVKGPSLVIRGQARDPLAFARINAMQLELGRSPLLQGEGVSLAKVERVEDRNKPALSASATPAEAALAALPNPVAFEITAPFATLEPARQLELMQRLGSEGMARRLQALRGEGLL